MRYLFTLCLLWSGFFSMDAQELLPILENPVLKRLEADRNEQLPRQMRFQGQSDNGLEKQNCELEQPGINYVVAGNTAVFKINIDTTGLDTIPGVYSCLNCIDNPIGFAEVTGDSLVFTADEEVLAGSYTFEVEFCNPNGCRGLEFDVVARRADRDYFPPTLSLEAEDITLAIADPGVLPGSLMCSFFVECEDAYEGRDQLVYFTDYDIVDTQFIYRASRYAGIDTVCLTLCDSFSVCDTYHFSFRIRKDTLAIPFMDDFSYEGPHPNIGQWLDTDVFINETMAENPPSLGVATFDGLNSRGRPYGGGYGEADMLTSTYLDLSNAGGDLFLTYWLQKRGLVDRPEVQDSFIVEFRNNAGQWISINNLPGSPINQPNTAEEPYRFYFHAIGQQFRYKGFRFRFRNLSDRAGIRDNWHLDYVRLSESKDSIFGDIAFTKSPAPILKNYTSMPWRHFQGNESDELADNIQVGLFNHFVEELSINESKAPLEELNSNVSLFDPVPTLFNDQDQNIPAGIPVNRSFSLLEWPNVASAVYSDYLLIMSGPAFDGFDKLEFLMKYSLTNTSQVNGMVYEAVFRNDTVEHVTVFDDYFAYDDGTAEAGLITPEGSKIAVQFATREPDTLRAVRIHIPRTGTNVSDQRFFLKVWVGQLDDSPEYEQLSVPYYADAFFDTLQGFTTYPLVDENGDFAPIALPPGNFYVGWEQESPCEFTFCFPVGYDKNRPQAKQFISRNFGQGWVPLPVSTVGGALMLRPVVGSQTPGFTKIEDVPPVEKGLRLYPNPVRDRLVVDLPEERYEEYHFQIFNNMGQLLREGRLTNQLQLDGLSSGIYYLRLTDLESKQQLNRKFIKIE